MKGTDKSFRGIFIRSRVWHLGYRWLDDIVTCNYSNEALSNRYDFVEKRDFSGHVQLRILHLMFVYSAASVICEHIRTEAICSDPIRGRERNETNFLAAGEESDGTKPTTMVKTLGLWMDQRHRVHLARSTFLSSQKATISLHLKRHYQTASSFGCVEPLALIRTTVHFPYRICIASRWNQFQRRSRRQ